MHNDNDRAAGATYIGPRAFAIAFCAVCGLFLAIVLGFNHVAALFDGAQAGPVAVGSETQSGVRAIVTAAATPNPATGATPEPVESPAVLSAALPKRESSLPRLDEAKRLSLAAPKPGPAALPLSVPVATIEPTPPTAPTPALKPQRMRAPQTVRKLTPQTVSKPTALSNAKPQATRVAKSGATARHTVADRATPGAIGTPRAPSPVRSSVPREEPSTVSIERESAPILTPVAEAGRSSLLLVPLKSAAGAPTSQSLQPAPVERGSLVVTPPGQ